MMSVLEYAQDVNRSVEEILSLCEKLQIKVNGEEDLLSQANAITDEYYDKGDE